MKKLLNKNVELYAILFMADLEEKMLEIFEKKQQQ